MPPEAASLALFQYLVFSFGNFSHLNNQILALGQQELNDCVHNKAISSLLHFLTCGLFVYLFCSMMLYNTKENKEVSDVLACNSVNMEFQLENT